jgi:hypothetical protein
VHLLDDDAYWPTGYAELAADLIKDDSVDLVGGPDFPAAGMGPVALALALALSSPFCTGTTFARHRSLGNRKVAADEEKLTSCNLWVRKAALEGISFPEDFLRGEETVFLQVLKARGARLCYDPRLRVGHHRRRSISALARPAFLSGFYRSRVLRLKLSSGGEVFWLPSVFVLLHLLALVHWSGFVELGKIYLGLTLSVSLGLAVKGRKPWLFPLVAFLHWYIVVSYGLGFLAERMRPRWS